jgi:hypothetical protein
MFRFAAILVVMSLLLSNSVAWAADGKVCKVLPQYLDKKGRQSLNPSLYERDAYQAWLRKHPKLRAALHVVVEYRASGLDWQKTRLRAEMRGLLTNSMQTVTMEQPVKKSGFFGRWAEFNITGEDYKKFGELVAWRVSIWEGDRQLSFLWSGVERRSP